MKLIHKPIVDECCNHVKIGTSACPKIFFEDGADRCRTYHDPAAIQHRCGRLDACPVMPREVKVTKAKEVMKRKFGSRTRR